MEKQEFDALVEKVGTEAANKIKNEMQQAEDRINKNAEEARKGLMSVDDFNKFKAEELNKIQDKLGEIEKLEAVAKEQGRIINEIKTTAPAASKSFEDWLIEQAPKIKELQNSGKFLEVSATELKAAGVQSIANTMDAQSNVPTNPYAPGIGGGTLEIFDIARNPNYISNAVDLGRTNQSRLAWANETSMEGAVAEVEEGEAKPQVQHKFKVEMSQAKKIAGWIKITEEFEQDLPQFATRVRRMLQEDVVRGFDDAIQAAVVAAAPAYSLPGLNASIPFTYRWDGILAMQAQVRYNNFIPNVVALNPLTYVLMQTEKDAEQRYVLPPFAGDITRDMVQANKIATGFALVGDLKQYKVDIYKEFYLKIGWVNDDLIKNQFTIVGEIRYHRYISDARKKALVYNNLNAVLSTISAGS